MTGTPDYRLSHLQALEAESIHIFREVAAELERRPHVFWREGLDRDAPPRGEGVLAGAHPVPGPSRGHRPELSGGHRVPRSARRAAEGRADRGIGARRHRARAGPPGAERLTEPDPDPRAARGRRGASVHRALRRRAARRGEGARQGADLQLPRRVRPMGSEEPAPGALEPLQRTHPPRRVDPRLPALELDRAGRLALHRRRGARDPGPVLRERARGLRARRDALRRERVLPAEGRGDPLHRAGPLPDDGRREPDRRGPLRRGHGRQDHRRDRDHAAHERGATRGDDRVSEAAMEDRKKEGYF